MTENNFYNLLNAAKKLRDESKKLCLLQRCGNTKVLNLVDLSILQLELSKAIEHCENELKKRA